MWKWAWLMVWAAALAAAQSAVAQAFSADEIVTRMMERDAERRAAIAAYRSERTYHMQYNGPIGERQAFMRVRMEFSSPDRKTFTVLSEAGSTIFCHQILRKLMEGEQEGALEANRLRSMLSPANYQVKLTAEEELDGTDAWVLEVAPKGNSRFTYKGRVWVSKADYAVMRIVGSPMKNPNILMGSSSFDYRYARSGAFWLPTRNDTVSNLRIGGQIKLTVEYGNYSVVAAPLGAVASSITRGDGKGMKGLTKPLPQ